MKYFISNAFTHGIGEYFEEETWVKLSSIFSTGGLLSENQLKALNINPMCGRAIGIKMNGKDYVSLLDLSHDLVKKKIISEKARFYLPYNENVITFIINPEIEKQESKRFGEFEVHIKDKVPLSYFKGIIVPEDKECQLRVFDTLEKFGVNLPVFNFDGEKLDKNKISETVREL